MRIGIYADVANEEQIRGVGYHVANLVEHLGRLGGEDEILLYYRRGVLREGPVFLRRLVGANVRLRPVRFPRAWFENRPRLWWSYGLPALIRADRLDVFHGPSHILPATTSVRTVVTIHDVAFFKMDLYSPGLTASLRSLTGDALRRADRVIALSENTRRDVEGLGVDPGRIRVIYGGGQIVPDDQIRHDRREEVRRTLGLPDRYILFVGYLHPRKNVPFLLRGFARLKQATDLPHKLVLAGARGPAADEIDALIRELGIASDVVITGYLEDWQMPLLYTMADLFVLPTLYEGFTLVTLEAMAYGVPTIATDTSSIREGTGDAAILVPLNDVDSLTSAIRLALTDEDLRRGMVARGRERARMFAWGRCAEETMALYRELGGPRARHAVPDPTPAPVAR